MKISYTEVSLEDQGVKGKHLDLKKWNSSKLKDNMWLSKENWRVKEIEFSKLIDLVKSDYRQVSPFTFANGIKTTENWSNKDQECIILDIDDGLTIHEAKNLFADLEYLIYTTKSHQVDKKGLVCDRFRMIFPAINIPIGDDYFKFTKVLEERLPFIDKQVNTKTGAFLGNFDCEYFYNDGKKFDCKIYTDIHSVSLVEPAQKIVLPPVQRRKSKELVDVEAIKLLLTREKVADIISSLGFPVDRKFMFKMRADERSASASISPDLLVKDFGSDFSSDIFGFVMETQGVSFPEAIEVVQQYA
jgi:hypothetical protein